MAELQSLGPPLVQNLSKELAQESLVRRRLPRTGGKSRPLTIQPITQSLSKSLFKPV